MSDLEKANAHMSAVDVRFLFTGAIVDGRVEVVSPCDEEGKAFLYRRSENKK